MFNRLRLGELCERRGGNTGSPEEGRGWEGGRGKEDEGGQREWPRTRVVSTPRPDTASYIVTLCTPPHIHNIYVPKFLVLKFFWDGYIHCLLEKLYT